MTWRSSVAMAAIGAFVPAMGLIAFPSGIIVVIARWLGLAWELALLSWLLMRRSDPRLAHVRVAFALTAVPLIPMSWLVTLDRAAQGVPAELFIREIAVSLLFAIATPPRAVTSVVVIALYAVESVLLYREGSLHAWDIWGWQPWANLLYAVLAILIAVLQAGRQRREIRFIIEIERLSARERLLRSHAAVRDLVNTPLQTLRMSLALLTRTHPDAAAIAARMDRAVDRLGDLNRALEAEVGDESAELTLESFDASAVLRIRPT